MSNASKYPHLFQPLVIGKQVFRNRIFSAPTGYLDLTPESFPTSATAAYYERRARGGVAAVTLGECSIHKDARGGSASMYLGNPASVGVLCSITNAVRKHGAVCSAEIQHWGKYAKFSYPGEQCYGPVECEATMGAFSPVKKHILPMSEEQIEEIIHQYGQAAAFAKKCGFNMLMIHSAHGWLLPQFMSPTNNREDQWGGSFENRMRLPIAVLKEVHRAVGPGFPLELRMSGTEACEGGYDIDYGVKIAEVLQDYVDIIHVSAGHHMNAFSTMEPSMFAPDQMNVKYAAEVKKHVTNALVATVGAINEPDGMEEIVASGKADIVEMARPLLADPDLVNKMREGREGEIRKCLRCMTCFSRLMATKQFYCAVNPEVGRELELKYALPPAQPKKVLVIGGGPGGMQAALTCSENGHHVILCEASSQLGGALRCEQAVPFKRLTMDYLDLQARRIEHDPNIELRLGVTVTPAYAKSVEADAIICAVGAKPFLPNLPGISTALTGEDAFRDISKVGRHAVIMGAGLVGCELGLYLAQNGRKVDIVEMAPAINTGGNFLHVDCLKDYMAKEDITLHFNTKAVEITSSGLVGEAEDGARVDFPADTVICAVGMTPLREEAFAFWDCAPRFYQIGDCLTPANICDAVSDAYAIARDISR